MPGSFTEPFTDVEDTLFTYYCYGHFVVSSKRMINIVSIGAKVCIEFGVCHVIFTNFVRHKYRCGQKRSPIGRNVIFLLVILVSTEMGLSQLRLMRMLTTGCIDVAHNFHLLTEFGIAWWLVYSRNVTSYKY